MAGSEYFNHTNYPAPGVTGSSQDMRDEFEGVEDGFGKLIALSANGNMLMKVNAAETAHEASIISDDGTTATVAGNLTVTGNTTPGTLVGFVIGTDIQAWDAVLDATTASYTTTLNTKLGGIEALADVTDTANVTSAGALMDSEVASLAAIKDIVLTAGLTISANWETADETKLTGIETSADVTDATNVNAAGAVMNSDADVSLMSFSIDEDTMVTDSAILFPTQQSVKAYVDAAVVGSVQYKGGYNAATDTPSLDDGSPIAGIEIGDMYTVTAAGNFFTVAVDIGDVLIAEIDSALVEGDWTVVSRDLDASTTTVQGIIRSSTIAETNTGTLIDVAVTPDSLDGWTGSAQIVTVGTITTGNIDALLPAASDTVAGIQENAVVSEADAASSALLTLTPSVLAASIFGVQPIGAIMVERATDCTVATFFDIPILAFMNGWELFDVIAHTPTAGTTGTQTMDLAKNGTTMFSTLPTIDSGETSTETGATPFVIKTDGTEDVATDDVITGKITGLHTTAAKGCTLIGLFRKP